MFIKAEQDGDLTSCFDARLVAAVYPDSVGDGVYVKFRSSQSKTYAVTFNQVAQLLKPEDGFVCGTKDGTDVILNLSAENIDYRPSKTPGMTDVTCCYHEDKYSHRNNYISATVSDDQFAVALNCK